MKMSGDYRVILRQELVERCQRNPKYSLRAFAKQLKTTSSRLSDVINGKKGLSRDAAHEISIKLGMSPKDREYFCDLVDSQHARNKTARATAAKRVSDRKFDTVSRKLNDDVFAVVSDWHHFAILQLIKMPKSSEDPSWIAKALGIQPIQVKDALDRLERLELIARMDGKFKVTSESVSAPDGIPSAATKKFNEQILKKAIEAIYVQPVSERDFCSMTIPFLRADLPKAREKIRGFLDEFCEEFSNSEKADGVYCLSTQLINHAAELPKPTTPLLKVGKK